MTECTLCELREDVEKLEVALEHKNIEDIELSPICFHCGKDYKRDEKYCGAEHTTWMPDCNCLNKPTIRIVTGKFNKNYYD